MQADRTSHHQSMRTTDRTVKCGRETKGSIAHPPWTNFPGRANTAAASTMLTTATVVLETVSMANLDISPVLPPE